MQRRAAAVGRRRGAQGGGAEERGGAPGGGREADTRAGSSALSTAARGDRDLPGGAAGKLGPREAAGRPRAAGSEAAAALRNPSRRRRSASKIWIEMAGGE